MLGANSVSWSDAVHDGDIPPRPGTRIPVKGDVPDRFGSRSPGLWLAAFFKTLADSTQP